MRILSKLLILIEIKYLVEYYLQLKQIDGKVNNLTIKNDQITIDSIVVNKNNTKFTLDNITINYSLDLNYKKSKIIADVKIDKIIGQNFHSDEFLNAKMNFLYNHHLIARKSNIQLHLNNILYKLY